MVSQVNEPCMRVNGAMLPMYTGQQVVLAGTVAQVRDNSDNVIDAWTDGITVSTL